MQALLDHWLLYAWIVPIAWGLAAVIDVLLIEWDIYENPLQASAISGFVVAFPLLLLFLPHANLQSLNATVVVVGLLSGVCYALHLLFYYQAMFTANDAAHAETFMNTEVVFVPVLAFIVLGERFADTNYLSIGLAGLGAIVMSWSARCHVIAHARLTRFLVCAVFASSAGFIVEDILFDLTDYSTGVVCFSIGLLLGIAPSLVQQGVGRTGSTLFRNFRLIFCAEIFALVASAAQMRAIEKSHSVSLVAVIESARPLLIMLMCLAAWVLVRNYRRSDNGTIAALREQFSAGAHKLTACALIAGGVYIASI